VPAPDSWEERVAAFWADASDEDPGLLHAMDALAAERPPGDPVAIYERASARDFAGRESDAEVLYREALAGGLAHVDERRAVEARVQLASTLRLLGRPPEAVSVLE
jgi:Tetratrico peptide repeat